MYFAQNVLAEDGNFAGGTMSIQNGTPMCDDGGSSRDVCRRPEPITVSSISVFFLYYYFAAVNEGPGKLRKNMTLFGTQNSKRFSFFSKFYRFSSGVDTQKYVD